MERIGSLGCVFLTITHNCPPQMTHRQQHPQGLLCIHQKQRSLEERTQGSGLMRWASDYLVKGCVTGRREVG